MLTYNFLLVMRVIVDCKYGEKDVACSTVIPSVHALIDLTDWRLPAVMCPYSARLPGRCRLSLAAVCVIGRSNAREPRSRPGNDQSQFRGRPRQDVGLIAPPRAVLDP